MPCCRFKHMHTSSTAAKNQVAPVVATSDFYQAPLPACIWQAVETLYNSIYCTQTHLRIHGGITPALRAWVWRPHAVIKAVLLFSYKNNVVNVLNEVVSLDPADLSAFSVAVFDRYKQISAIVFHAVRVGNDMPRPYPMQRSRYTEDFVLMLPPSEKLWLDSLSKQTREKIRYHTRRSQRKQPDLVFYHASRRDITDAMMSAIIGLNRSRMESKGRAFGMDSNDERKLRALLHERGLATMLFADGRLCAGLLCTVCEKDIYMHVISHDRQFDDLRLGFLCCCRTIGLCIEQGMHRFHFLWGEYDYKIRLGGVRQDLHDLAIFRSVSHALLHPFIVCRLGYAALRQSVRAWRNQHRRAAHVR